MKVTIEYLSCGAPETLIDCSLHAAFQCSFCKEYSSWFSETKEVSPEKLVELIKEFKYVIKLVNKKKTKIMKEIIKERTNVEKYKVYQATDGTEFTSYEECRKYEDSALGIVRGNVAKLIVGRTDDAWKLMGGNDANSVIAIKMNSEADADLVKQLFLLEHPYYNDAEREELKLEKFTIIENAYNNGDVVLFGINCDMDYYFINSRQNIIDNLNNLASKKDTQEK